MKILVKRTSIQISPYNEENRCETLETGLSVYNQDYFRLDPIGYDYRPETETLIIPRSVSLRVLENTFNCPVTIDRTHDEIEKARIKLNSEPRNDLQRKAIAFLLGKGEYEDIATHSRLMLELDTGIGKTYCAIAAISYMKVKGAIILNSKKLMAQWKDKLQEYTNLSDKEIYTVAGSASIDRIMKGKCEKCKIFLVSHNTVTTYANKHGWDSITELFQKMKIGVKVFDEAHQRLANTIMIDLYTNTKRTYYLTATAERSNYRENKLFIRVYGPVPILSVKRNKEQAYVKSIVLNYDSSPSFSDQGLLKNKHGMNVNRYIDYMVFGRARAKFYKCLGIILNTVLPREGTIAILLGRKKAVADVAIYIKKNFSEFADEVGIFTSDVKDKDERVEQLKKKIILTTFKSFGTGIDLDDKLRAVVMCEPYSSKVTLHQTIGRLRQVEGADLYYFELVDTGVKQRVRQFESIKNELLKSSEKVTSFNIP